MGKFLPQVLAFGRVGSNGDGVWWRQSPLNVEMDKPIRRGFALGESSGQWENGAENAQVIGTISRISLQIFFLLVCKWQLPEAEMSFSTPALLLRLKFISKKSQQRRLGRTFQMPRESNLG